MKVFSTKILFFGFLIACIAVLLPFKAHAIGAFVTTKEFNPINTETQAVIFYDGKRETIIANETFKYDPYKTWQFYWLIPTPSKPVSQVLQGDIFAELDKLLSPEAIPDTFKTRTDNLLWGKPFLPIPRTTNLRTDFFNMGFYPTKRLMPLLEDYVRNGWYMTAVLVDGTHLPNDMSVKEVHTIPFQISFDTDEIVYPLALTSTNGSDLDFNAFQDIDPRSPLFDVGESPELYARGDTESETLKTVLYIFSSAGAEIPGFKKTAETIIDGKKFSKGSWNSFYLNLPTENLRLEKFENISSFAELKDARIKLNRDNPMTASLLFTDNFFRSRPMALYVLYLVLILVLFAFADKRYGFSSKVKNIFSDVYDSSAFLQNNSGKILIAGSIVLVVAGSIFYKSIFPNSQNQNAATAILSGSPMGDMAMGGNVGQSSQKSDIQEFWLKSGSFFFLPNEIKVKAGEKVLLHIESVGEHDFTVNELGLNVKTPDGKTTDIEFTPEIKGSFEFYCSLPGHKASGQFGTLIVE